MNTGSLTQEKKNMPQYAKMFSSLFCSMSIMTLSTLCLLNNLSLDLYSATCLLMTVLPGACCFWLIGFIIGKIFDNDQCGEKTAKKANSDMTEEQAYEMPSMFASMDSVGAIDDDIFGDL